jgi:hypothetical protein
MCINNMINFTICNSFIKFRKIKSKNQQLILCYLNYDQLKLIKYEFFIAKMLFT